MSALEPYRGLTITLTGRQWFSVRLPGSDRDTQEETYEKLTKRIDSFFTQQRKTRKLKLPVVDSSGAQWNITGINLHTSQVTGQPPKVDGTFPPYTYEVYPDVEWIRGALGHIRDLWADIRETKELLAGLDIRPQRDRAGPQDYGEKLDVLEKEYGEKLEKAQIAEDGK